MLVEDRSFQKFVSSRNALLSGTGTPTPSVWVKQLVQASSLSDPNLKGTVKRIRKRSDSKDRKKNVFFLGFFFAKSSQDSSGQPVVKEDVDVSVPDIVPWRCPRFELFSFEDNSKKVFIFILNWVNLRPVWRMCWPQTLCLWASQAIKTKEELQIAASKIKIYSKKELVKGTETFGFRTGSGRKKMRGQNWHRQTGPGLVLFFLFSSEEDDFLWLPSAERSLRHRRSVQLPSFLVFFFYSLFFISSF